jgi:hypothetical protein
MELRTSAVVLLLVALADLGQLTGARAHPPVAPATVHNYCAHPIYAPGGTDQPVVMAGPGFSTTVPCGRGAGNVYAIRTLYPTRIVDSDGSNVCWRAGSEAPVRTGSARVYTVAGC